MKGKRINRFSSSSPRLTRLLAVGIISFMTCMIGHHRPAVAQWLASNLNYPLTARSMNSTSWMYFPYSQTSWAPYPSAQEPSAWPSISSFSGWWGGSFLPVYAFPSAFSKTFPNSYAFNIPWAISPYSLSSLTAAFTPLPVERQVTGVESRQIAYMSFASQRSGLTYAPGIPVYAANQVIVQFVPGTPSTEVGRICAMHQCQHIYSSPYAGYSLLNISPSTTPLQAVQRLRTEASVVYAEPNYYRSAHLLPNDPYYKYQWHLGHLNCSYAWDYGTGAGAVVALLDSGVAYETSGLFAKAPDLAGTLFVPGYDFVNDDTFPDDDYGHGTHMAGCIAQTTNNLIGAAGVAFGAAIMPVKIMDDIGGVLISDEVDGIYFAANNGAHIINMSLGGPGTSVTEAAAVTYAYSRGVTVICSAGNSGSNTAEYPASYPEPVSVSAVRYDFTFASTYSNYGIYVDLCAPGGDLSLDQNGDGFGDGILQQTHDGQNFSTFSYYFLEGTSPASALVSGVAALIVGKSTVPLPPSDVVSILKGSAADLGTSGWDQYYGYGLINAYQAMLQTP